MADLSALSGTPGPVHLTIPQDILSAEIDEADLARIPDSSSTGPSLSSGDSSSLDRFASLLRDSSRPLLIAGSGVFYSNGESALAEFAEKCSRFISKITNIKCRVNILSESTADISDDDFEYQTLQKKFQCKDTTDDYLNKIIPMLKALNNEKTRN